MKLFNRLLINAIFIFGGKIFEGVLQLAVLAFILSHADREYYATALLIISIQATIDLARGGIQKATLKFIAEYKAKDDLKSVTGVLSSSSALQGFIGLLGLMACIVVSPFSTTLLSLPEYMKSEAQWSIVLLGFGIAITFGISPWQNSVAAQERYDLLSLATSFGKLIRAILILILLSIKAPVVLSIVMATVIGGVAERLTCIGFVKKISPDLKFAFKGIQSGYIKLIFNFSFFDFFHTLSGFLYSQGALFLAAHMISLDVVASIGIITSITSLIGMVMVQFGHMLVPVASRLSAVDDTKKLKELVSRGTTITVFAGGIAVVGIIPWIRSFLYVWLGQNNVELGLPAIVLVAAAYLVNSLTLIHNSLCGMGKVAVDGISNSICTALGLLIGTALILWADLALMGLVFGLLCARLFRFMFINWYGSKSFSLSIIEFLWRGYLRTYLLVFAICYAGFKADLLFTSWNSLIFAGCLTAALYFLAGIFWVLEEGDLSPFVQAVKKTIAYFKSKIQNQKL